MLSAASKLNHVGYWARHAPEASWQVTEASVGSEVVLAVVKAVTRSVGYGATSFQLREGVAERKR